MSSKNPEIRRASQRVWRAKNAEKVAAYQKEWHTKNREHLQAQGRRWRSENREILLPKKRAWGMADLQKNPAKYRAFYQRDRVKILLKAKQRQQNQRRLCIEHYGGWICTCCGETTPEFLTIDHIKGGGTAERKRSGEQRHLYLRLIAAKFPPGFQVLCYNCNCSKGAYGQCPHQRAQNEQAS